MKVGKFDFLILLTVTVMALAYAKHACAEVLFVPMDTKARVDETAFNASVPDHARRPVLWRPPQPTDLPFRVTSSRVDVRIEENVATTTLEQAFLNLSGRDLEVRVMIPLPAGAAINKSALSMNDQMVEGKLYNAQEAQAIYESIVFQRRDPALLRFAGDNLYEARVFPIPPNQERRLKFSYDQVLEPTGGLYDYRHILSGSQLYRTGVENFKFECVIRGKAQLGPIYSPSHTVAVERPDEHTAIVRLSDANLATDRDFRLYYVPSTEDVALRLIAHRAKAGEDGYFMLLGRPDDQLEKSRILPKELVFVFDVSGSMAGEKIEQAKKALSFCLSQLNAQDRFNLITFSTSVNALSPNKLLDATKENVKQALAAVETIEATGGTNIDEALRTALAQDFTAGPGKAKLIVFMTDGLPSVGVTDPQSILRDVETFNAKQKIRVFNFGVGADVNTHLLDRISRDFEGVSAYVAPKEDLELKVSDFYAKIKNPVMTDLTFDFGTGALAGSFYPKKIPALFKGSEIVLVGRFKGSGPGTVSLKGYVGGEPRELKLAVNWPAESRENPFLPRVWATRKIGHLLEDIRLNGPNQELIQEVVELSQRHGIVTPYTSQLVLEPGMRPEQFLGGRPPAPGRGAAFGENGDRDGRERAVQEQLQNFKADAQANGPKPAEAPAAATKALDEGRKQAVQQAGEVADIAKEKASGDIAVALAETERLFKDATTGAAEGGPGHGGGAMAPDGKADKSEQEGKKLRNRAFLARKGGEAGKQEDAEELAGYVAARQDMTIKQIGTRTFYLRQGLWVDSTFPTDAKPTVVKSFSKEYFELLKMDKEMGSVLALGGRILVLVNGQAYQIEDAGAKE